MHLAIRRAPRRMATLTGFETEPATSRFSPRLTIDPTEIEGEILGMAQKVLLHERHARIDC
jgi:hypothetical protein